MYSQDWQNVLRQSLQRERFSFEADMMAKNYRPAAVLILFWEEQGHPSTVVTVRSSSMPSHAGEVSFPGGGLKPGENHDQAALREAEEEIGLSSEGIQVLGHLDDAWSGAGFALRPVVAVSEHRPQFTTSHEVEQVVPVNLVTGIEWRERTVTKFGNEITEPFIRAGETDVVGLTADIFSEAVEALEGRYTERGRRRHDYFQRFAKSR